MAGNPFEQLSNLYLKPALIPGETSQVDHLTPEDKTLLQRIGLTSAQVRKDLLQDTQIFYDRYNLYHHVEQALEHSIVGAATELYANYCTVFSPLHNSTIWVTSESPTYQRELTKLLDRIGIEEKIFDWAFTAGSYGDMFVKINGIPGQGVVSVDDSDHPINISRVDHEGILIGYYKSPLGQGGDQQKLLAPWEYVHFRLLGGKKQRPQFGDQNYSEFRTVHLLTGLRSKQVTTRYGTSLLLNALPIYRRLRLAEDSLLMARLSRGLIRYIWKLKVTHCLQKDTQISLTEGTNLTIGKMAENPEAYIGKLVLTVNEKTKHLEPKKIKGIKKTRLNAQLVQVYLDNCKSVTCTPDHRFMLRDGTYRAAQDLMTKDSLMPYYSCLNREEIQSSCKPYNPGRSCSVVKVVWLSEKEDTYDIEIEGTPNLPLTAGVFVHNSNMEAVGELIDQYSRVLREARSMDTRDASPNFDSKENPMACIEDIFVPVWDDVGDLTFDKIGGETDIRWIKDIEDLRQQLAAALRTPLPLLGAWLKEATGPLGSQAIEKADINFARMARKLQRTVRNGVKRICQIHLAYMNMDPDPTLFDIQMPEMSTAEEESLKESLRDGAGVISDLIDVIEKCTEGGDRELDKIELFNYFNQKFLKLEDLDLKDFVVSSGAIPECTRREERMAKELQLKQIFEKAMKGHNKAARLLSKPVLFDTDLVSYVPTRTRTTEGKLDEKAVKRLCRRGGWLGVDRCKEAWQRRFGDVMVMETEAGEELDTDVDGGGQLILPFEKDK